MLVLSRKQNQQIVIGSDVTVTVVEIRGDKVRLGISAPGHIPVDRLEISLLKQQEQNHDQSQRSQRPAEAA